MSKALEAAAWAADLPALLSRLEVADGPHREIDALLMLAIEPPTGDAFWRWRGLQPKGARERAEAELQAVFARQHAPAYTVSLDAALALRRRVLPEWEVLLSNEGEPANQWVANVGPRDTFDGYAAKSSGPALALCIAIVKALIAQQAKDAP